MCWSAWSSIAAKAACSRVNTRLSSAPKLSQAATPSLRGGSRVSAGTRPSAFCRARRCSRSTSQPCANAASYFTDQFGRRLVRRMAGAQCQPGEPRRARRIGRVVGDHADGLVHQIGRQVVAAGEGAGRIDMGVVAHQLGRVLVGLGVHEAVEAVEAAAQRPAVEGAGRAALRQRRDMPLAEHVVAKALRAQHLGQRAGLARDLAAVARVAAVEVGQAAHAHRMVVAPGQQRGARGAAHRRGVEAAVAQAAPRQCVDVRRADGRAVAAEVGEADIVEQDHQDVGRARGRLGRLRPVWNGG